jgi:pilus assembly protein CpaB
VPKFSNFMERFTPRQLLLLCCVIALVVFLLIYFTLTRLTAEKPKPVAAKPTTAMIVVAQKDIAPRELIRPNMVKLKEVPSNAVPTGAVHRTTDIIGRPAKVGIIEGEVVTGQKLYASVQDAGLSGRIPPDCRAVTVSISEVTGVAGFAKPGDYVDVMLVSSNVEPHKVVSEMVLQNVLLLAINKSTDNPPPAQPQNKNANQGQQGNQAANQNKNVTAVGNPATATLALTPEDSLKLAAKAQLGQIYLALRPFRPAVPNSEETYYSVTKATGRAQPGQNGAAPVAGVDDPMGNIQVIRGTTTTVGR